MDQGRRRGDHRRGRRRRSASREADRAAPLPTWRQRIVTTMAAVDIGAQSGRVVVGRLDGERLAIEEVHRFPNVPVHADGRLHWDILQLYEQVLEGISVAARVAGEIDSVGIDTWGVDF